MRGLLRLVFALLPPSAGGAGPSLKYTLADAKLWESVVFSADSKFLASGSEACVGCPGVLVYALGDAAGPSLKYTLDDAISIVSPLPCAPGGFLDRGGSPEPLERLALQKGSS